MALTEGQNGMFMPVAPAYGGGNGLFGQDGAWIILLLLLGWGNNGGFGGGNNMYPWMQQSAQISDGFQNAALGDQITGIQASLNNMGTANLQQSFALQQAMNQGFNGLQSQLAQCCCENRMATADLKYTIAQEACNDRQAIAQGIQTILDKMCAQEILAYQRENAQLRDQLNMQALAASQTAQTAQLEAFILANKSTTTAG